MAKRPGEALETTFVTPEMIVRPPQDRRQPSCLKHKRG